MIEFNGDEWLVSTPSLTAPTNVTVCFWVMPTDLSPGNHRVFGTDHLFEARFNSTSFFHDLFTDGGLQSSLTYSTDTWYHFALTRDTGNNAIIYVNGSQDVTANNHNDIPPANPLVLGARYFTGDRLVGSLEDFRIYNRVLSADEILTIYNGLGLDYILEGLIHWFPLMEGYEGQDDLPVINYIDGGFDLRSDGGGSSRAGYGMVKNNFVRRA